MSKRLLVLVSIMFCAVCFYLYVSTQELLNVEYDAPPDVNELIKMADDGDAKSQHKIAGAYAHGRGVEQDNERAFYYYKKAADQGYVRSQNYVGVFYDVGRGVEKNQSLAIEWLQKAAEQNYVIAQHNLGLLYFRNQNYEEAFTWFQKAAEQGDVRAQSFLGLMLDQGLGVEKNREKAILWLQKAIKGQHAGAYNVLARIYDEGVGGQKDLLLAGQYYKKASTLEIKSATKYLNEMNEFCKKQVQPKSHQVEACLIAAGARYPEAQVKLSKFYKEGTGVEKDIVESYAWMKSALSLYENQEDKTVSGLYTAMSKYLNALADSAQAKAEMNTKATEYLNRYGGGYKGED